MAYPEIDCREAAERRSSSDTGSAGRHDLCGFGLTTCLWSRGLGLDVGAFACFINKHADVSAYVERCAF